MKPVYLSPSGLATYENCGYSYYLSRVMKVKKNVTSSNLGFGAALATSMEAFALSTLRGPWVNPVDVFQRNWSQFTSSNNVEYPRHASKESFAEIGTVLMEKFPDAWRKEGFTVALDQNVVPMVERKMQSDLGRGVVLVTKLDLVVHRDDEFILLDEKSAKTATTVEFTLLADQLTAYQVALEVNELALGLGQIGGVGYWELLKTAIPKTTRGAGPVVLAPKIVKPRTGQEVAQFIKKVHDTADRIRAGQFPKTPRMSWNSPCSSCDFRKLCAQGDKNGLVFPSREVEAVVTRLAA